MPREFENDGEIVAWSDSLDKRWPERETISETILSLLEGLCCSQSTIVELCCGDGRLARRVVDAIPDAHYVGVDASAALCAYASRSTGMITVQADLREPGWESKVKGPVDAILTLQSLHDVGDGGTIERIYKTCSKLLGPKGTLIVADFMGAENAYDPERPGRLPISWHQAILALAGFEEVGCQIEAGAIGCVSGVRP